ncbi:hypothetical protein VTK26DRAFT_4198 [Humicola hyalothermophila]
MTIPLVSVADRRGHHFVLSLNLIPRLFLLAWTFAVGYFDQVLPINAILAAPVLSFLGGDCVFNSIIYSLVSDLTDDHVLRATFFGYATAVTSIFSSQLGPAAASATMTMLLWLPLWIGIILLFLTIPVVSALPRAVAHHRLASDTEEGDTASPLISTPARAFPSLDHKPSTASRFRSVLAILTNPSRNFLLLLTCFFLASLASSDTKLLPLYISTRYHWRFSSVGYLLSAKALFNFLLLSLVIPRFLRWRQARRQPRSSSPSPPATTGSSDPDGGGDGARDANNIASAYTCLVFSVLGALAIALSPVIWALVPSLLLYALGIALPMFTYSLLRSPSMRISTAGTPGAGAEEEEDGSGSGGPGTQLFSVVMLVRTVGTLLGAVLMPSLWVAGLGIGGMALGMPYVVSAACYAVAGVLVRRIKVA